MQLVPTCLTIPLHLLHGPTSQVCTHLFVSPCSCILHRSDSTGHIHGMTCHTLNIAWNNGPFCSTCIWRLGIMLNPCLLLFVIFIFSSFLCLYLWCSLLFLLLSCTVVCDLLAFTLLAHNSTCLPLIAINSLIISAVRTSLFISIMHYSFSHLSFSLYLHSVAFILILYIHSSIFSSLCLSILQYWSDSIVSLHSGLNFLFSISNSPDTVWHDSCLICINVCMKLTSSLPGQFLLLAHYPHQQFHNAQWGKCSVLPFQNYSILCTCQWLSSYIPVVLRGSSCSCCHGFPSVGLSSTSDDSSASFTELCPDHHCGLCCFCYCLCDYLLYCLWVFHISFFLLAYLFQSFISYTM